MVRSDLRSNQDLRPIQFSMGKLTTNDASCVYSCGDTTVACGIYGPVEAKGLQGSFKGMIGDVTVRSPVGMPTHSERHMETVITDLIMRLFDCEKFPYNQMNVSLEILSDDGSVLSAAINAFMLAVAGLGIPLRSSALSTSVASIDGALVVDPSLSEESLADAVSTQAICLTTGKVMYSFQHKGSFSVAEIGQVASLCQTSSKSLEEHLSAKQEKVNNSTKAKW